MADFPIFDFVPQRSGMYASFPTACVTDSAFHVYYRLGQVGNKRSHGGSGVIYHRQIPLDEFRKALLAGKGLVDLGEDKVLFQEHNEMDAILTQFEDGTYALGTRYFAEDIQGMVSFLSRSDNTSFEERRQVMVDGVAWLVFYGHGVRVGEHSLLPAYGGYTDDGPLMRPMLIKAHVDRSFSLFSAFPEAQLERMFNESSLVFHEGLWQMFMRHHGKPFGVWRTRSTDLQKWEKAEEVLSSAQAPMAFVHRDRLGLCIRRILEDGRGSFELHDMASGAHLSVDTYEGFVYDGGYGDTFVVDGSLFVIYYHGNHEGEPSIRVAGPLPWPLDG